MKPFDFFRRKSESGRGQVFVPSAGQRNSCFSAFDRYVPLSRAEFGLYDSIREGVPVVDAAVSKLVNLAGGVKATALDPAAQEGLDEFLRTVPVSDCMVGIESFISQYLDGLLMYGTAVGEMIPSAAGNTISALYCCPLQGIEIRQKKGGGAEIAVFRKGQYRPVRYPELTVMSVLCPKAGELRGNSLLRSLPFVSGILTKIFETEKINFERVGNLRFAVTYKPTDHASDKAFAKDRAAQIASAWSKAMREAKDGKVSDFVAVGDVDIKVIGADSQVLDYQVPVRQMTEQIISRLGIPPFMLGLSWSSTERMSSQQADMLTSEIWGYRRIIIPAIRKICSMWLTLNGYDPEVDVDFEDISLQDEVELAKAELYRMQAEQIKQKLTSQKDD